MAKMKPPVSPWAEEIREARKRAGLTQQALAALLGLASSTVYRAERGRVGEDQKARKAIDAWLARVRAARNEAA